MIDLEASGVTSERLSGPVPVSPAGRISWATELVRSTLVAFRRVIRAADAAGTVFVAAVRPALIRGQSGS